MPHDLQHRTQDPAEERRVGIMGLGEMGMARASSSP